MDSIQNRPLALLIVDGWGIGADDSANAIARAYTPYYDEICRAYPHTGLNAAGESVGLSNGDPGNAEAGHLNIGTGRKAMSNAQRIAAAIRSGDFFENAALVNAFHAAREGCGRLHLIGLLSDAEIHSLPETLFALLRMAKRIDVPDVFIHGILDGVDVPPRTADIYTEAMEIKIADIGKGKIATLCGRFFAMDSSENWERTARAFTMLVHGEGEQAVDPRTAIRSAFLRGISDEYISPIVIDGLDASIRDGDTVVFFNHRPDTIRQLVRSLVVPDTRGFAKPKVNAVCITEYDRSFSLPVAFGPETAQNSLADLVSYSGIHMYRIAESTRTPLITNAFDGGSFVSRPNEKTILIESGDESERAFCPEMRNFKITDSILRTIESDNFAFVVADFASPGRIAETRNIEQTVEAVQYLDTCIGGIVQKIAEFGGTAIITSTHGNCEQMFNSDDSANHFATSNQVPFHLVGRTANDVRFKEHGSLQDIAPTILTMLGLPIPNEMTGRNLLA